MTADADRAGAGTARLGGLAERLGGDDEELRRALAYLPTDRSPADVRRAAAAAGCLAGLVTLPVALWVGLAAVATVALGLAAAVGTALAVGRLPVVAAATRRTRAVGAATDLVGRVVLRTRISPAPERAAAFAARTGDGPLADSLCDHVRRARGGAGSGLRSFGAAWSTWFPALERGLALVEAAAAEPPAERERTLDRATAAVREGTRDRMASFAEEIRGPAAAIYAFGVLLPLALVGIVPAARVAGVRVTVPAIVVLYDLVLPVVLGVATVRLLVRRPVALPPPRIGRDHPDVPDRAWRGPLAGVVAGGLAWLLAARLVGPWSGPIGGVGVGVGAALAVHHRPVRRVRDEVRAVEADLDDALYLVGRRVAGGEAVETALAAATERLDGPIGAVFEDADGVRRRLGTTVRDAFLGPHGALADLPSPRLRGGAELLALAAREGPPAGDALTATAEHVAALREIEAEGRRELAHVTSTLANTAAVFGPLVAGTTVALSDGVAAGAGLAVAPGARAVGGTVGPGLSTAALGTAVGAYVLVLAPLLTLLSTGLERGLDRALLGHRIGLALCGATGVYLAAVRGAGLVL